MIKKTFFIINMITVITVINLDKLIYIIYHFRKVLSKIYNLKHFVNYVIFGKCQLVLYMVLHDGDLDLLLYQLICFNISKAQWLRYSTCVLQTTSLILHRAFVHIHSIRFFKSLSIYFLVESCIFLAYLTYILLMH